MLLRLILAGPASAATLVVGGSDHPTFQSAIDAAEDGDTLSAYAGTYEGPLSIVDLDITLEAQGEVILTGADLSLVYIQDSAVRIEGLTFQPTGGRAVEVHGGAVELEDVVFSATELSDTPFDGAALAAFDGADVTIEGGDFDDNRVSTSAPAGGLGGSLHADAANLTVRESHFDRSQAWRGAAIYHQTSGTLTVEDCVFADGTADNDGGAIFISGAVVALVEGSELSGNQAGRHGGAIAWAGDDTGTLTVSTSVLTANGSGSGGGAIHTASGQLFRLVRSELASNVSPEGGAAYLAGASQVEVDGNTLCANQAGQAGAAFAVVGTGPSTFVHNVLYEHASAIGGGWWFSGAQPAALTNNSVLGAAATGGAVARVDTTDVTLTNNLFAHTFLSLAISSPSGTVEHSYNAWFTNNAGTLSGGTGTGAIGLDPRVQAYTADGLCNDDARPDLGSPLIDAGDTTLLDPDGTRSDIGAFGGPGAIQAFEDDDNDGSPNVYDCAPDNPAVFPGASEACNGVDNDCDDVIDSPNAAGAQAWFRDDDADGYGVTASVQQTCEQPPGWALLPGDCDDNNRQINPSATEECDGIDNDCNSNVDGNDAIDALVWFEDADGDGYGYEWRTISACEEPEGHVLNPLDCDDEDATINPDGTERCDEADNDCNGTVDDFAVDAITWYLDADLDGYGGIGADILGSCKRPDGYARTDDDCRDGDPSVHPRAEESCANPDVDTNCDGFTGRDDADGDGFPACEDCDDGDPTVYPGAADTLYDGVVTDCDSTTDFDADRDGYEAEAYGGHDCDDNEPTAYPGAEELLYDTIDNDCDGEAPFDPNVQVPDEGCSGCASTGGSSWWALGLFLGLARRRR